MKYMLSVEDSEFFSANIKRAVEKSIDDITVITANNMVDAEALLDSGKHDFFLALLDMGLPDAPDGEVIDIVAKYKIPIFVFSSMMEDDLRSYIFTKPVVDYLLKDDTACIRTLIMMVNRFIRNATSRILYVDDSKTAQRFIIKLLKRYNFDVLTANNGREALGIIKDNPDIKLVLTDFNMPEMDGLELTRAIRKQFPKRNIAIIGLSADADTDGSLSSKFLKCGSNDFLHKNFQREELFCRIHQNLNLVEYINELSDFAANDFLTGLPNRRTFYTMGETLIESTKRRDLSTVVAMMDVDFFKKINDTWGHNTGDKVLKAISDKLASRCRVSDIVARIGGEEFAFIGMNISDDQALNLLNEFKSAVEEVIVEEQGNTITPTISIGYTMLNLDENFTLNLDNLIQLADDALYKAKENGRNRIEKHDLD